MIEISLADMIVADTEEVPVKEIPGPPIQGLAEFDAKPVEARPKRKGPPADPSKRRA